MEDEDQDVAYARLNLPPNQPATSGNSYSNLRYSVREPNLPGEEPDVEYARLNLSSNQPANSGSSYSIHTPGQDPVYDLGAPGQDPTTEQGQVIYSAADDSILINKIIQYNTDKFKCNNIIKTIIQQASPPGPVFLEMDKTSAEKKLDRDNKLSCVGKYLLRIGSNGEVLSIIDKNMDIQHLRMIISSNKSKSITHLVGLNGSVDFDNFGQEIGGYTNMFATGIKLSEFVGILNQNVRENADYNFPKMDKDTARNKLAIEKKWKWKGKYLLRTGRNNNKVLTIIYPNKLNTLKIFHIKMKIKDEKITLDLKDMNLDTFCEKIGDKNIFNDVISDGNKISINGFIEKLEKNSINNAFYIDDLKHYYENLNISVNKINYTDISEIKVMEPIDAENELCESPIWLGKYIFRLNQSDEIILSIIINIIEKKPFIAKYKIKIGSDNSVKITHKITKYRETTTEVEITKINDNKSHVYDNIDLNYDPLMVLLNMEKSTWNSKVWETFEEFIEQLEETSMINRFDIDGDKYNALVAQAQENARAKKNEEAMALGYSVVPPERITSSPPPRMRKREASFKIHGFHEAEPEET